MIEQKFGPRRCRDTRKPLAGQCPHVLFYHCNECNTWFQMTGHGTDYPKEREIICCKGQAVLLHAIDSIQAKEKGLEIDYQITGGYNDNAVKVSWKVGKLAHGPEWIYLKTFTGGYLKYVAETKKSPMAFALSDTDAFAYCDEDPCLECVFRCKRGFIIYVYSSTTGLIEVPLDRMTAQWQSGAKDGPFI